MKYVAAFLVYLLVACGGGGGGNSASGAITPAAAQRTDLMYGYYGGCVTNIIEEADHVNLYWATGSCNSSGDWFLDMAAEITVAKGAGIRNIVIAPWKNMVWGEGAADTAAFQLERLAATGVLNGLDSLTVYPQDEPDMHGYTEAQVVSMVAMYRAIFARLPQYAHAKLGVIYNCRGERLGIALFDIVGCDDYDRMCSVLTSWYQTITLGPGQSLILVPGGASPWKQDPACFENYANSDKRVVAIIPFIWQTVPGNEGIRVNGMRQFYCEAGRKIKGDPTPC